MSGIGFTNHELVAKSYDANSDNKIDSKEIPNIGRFSDNNPESVSVADLASSLKSDRLSIKNGMLAPGEPININVKGLDNLKQINSVASEWTPYAYPVWDRSSLEGSDGLREVETSNYRFSNAIRGARTNLERIDHQSRGYNDSISSSVNSTAESAIRQDEQLGFSNLLIGTLGSGGVLDWAFSDPYAGRSWGKVEPKFIEDKQSGQQVRNPNWHDPYESLIDNAMARNSNLHSSYMILNNALDNIKGSTSSDKLPDIKANIVATDNAISAAFSNVNAIESHNSHGDTPDKVKEKLGKLSADQAAQVGNRAVTWGLPGAGAGAVVGGAIGFFAGKNSPLGAGKSAAIGAAVGTIVVGGISALVGHSKDEGFKQNSSDLSILGEKVTTYNTKQASKDIQGAANQTYGVMINANGDQSINKALGITESVKGIKVTADNIRGESSVILRAYEGTTAKEVLGK
jgi:hypothetical protein